MSGLGRSRVVVQHAQSESQSFRLLLQRSLCLLMSCVNLYYLQWCLVSSLDSFYYVRLSLEMFCRLVLVSFIRYCYFVINMPMLEGMSSPNRDASISGNWVLFVCNLSKSFE